MCILCFPATHRKGVARRATKVKGREGIDDGELTENEWSRACNLRDRDWLHVVSDCGTPRPRLLRVHDPFYKLIAAAKGGVIVGERDIMKASRGAILWNFRSRWTFGPSFTLGDCIPACALPA